MLHSSRTSKTGPAAGDDAEPLSQHSNESLQLLMQNVARIVKTGSFKPPLLPEVAMQLAELAAADDVELADVENAVTRDPAIAGRILSVARSALYSRGAPVKSLRVAIMRIGLNEVRDVAFQLVAGTRIFRVPGYSDRVRTLFAAAQASGLVGREICRHTGLEMDLAYLCGLLHDIGEPLLLGIIADLLQKAKLPLVSVDQLRPMLDRYHSAVGAKVCELWELPDAIGDAVLFHHLPSRSEHPSRMAALVAAVDLVLSHVGIGTEARRIDASACPLLTEVGLSVPQAEAVLEFAEMLAETPGNWAMPAEPIDAL